ncbi:hypothetical protein [Thalassovita aquimarina]|uniref:Type II secretion system protein n=1 Tax=Thalassovita aquimarina TaxID=2785917 RepID=A0ABS5HTH1_9RHOB|nr:hypothetical protein [Thalassovita aquimarina]MBR9652184.1 hypothetical protein [Thalassovita aquimarina]
MQADRLAQTALAALVAGLVVFGLLTVGGPGKGRIEKRDDTRMSDLLVLSSYVRCVADTQGKTLPASLAPVDTCQRDLRLTDPYTDTPYRYERVSDTAYRLCAGFEDPDWIIETRGADIDRATGCLQYTYTP